MPVELEDLCRGVHVAMGASSEFTCDWLSSPHFDHFPVSGLLG